MRTVRLLMTGAALALLAGLGAVRADEAEDKAIKAIEQVGGHVYRADRDGKAVLKVTLRGEATDASLKELAALKELDSLFLSGTGLTDAGLKELAACKQLQELRLLGKQFTD